MAGMLYYPCIPTGVGDGDPEVQSVVSDVVLIQVRLREIVFAGRRNVRRSQNQPPS